MRHLKTFISGLDKLICGPYLKDTNVVIPYTLDNSQGEFSHNGYTGLYFSETQRKERLLMKLKLVVLDRNSKFELLIDSLAEKVPFTYRRSFFRFLREYFELSKNDDAPFKRLYKAKELRRKNVIEYLQLKESSIPIKVSSPYPWSRKKLGSINRLVESAMIAIMSGDLEIKNQIEFIRWYAMVFNQHIGEGVDTIRNRIIGGIENEVKIEKLASFKFLERIKETRNLKNRRGNSGKK
jgi:hypothetical protein